MNSKDFRNWLLGFFEIRKPEMLSLAEAKVIKEHIELVRSNHSADELVNFVDGVISGLLMEGENLLMAIKASKILQDKLVNQNDIIEYKHYDPFDLNPDTYIQDSTSGNPNANMNELISRASTTRYC